MDPTLQRRPRRSRRPLVVTAVVAAVVAVVAVGLFVFEPQSLLTGKRVDDTFTTAEQPATVGGDASPAASPPAQEELGGGSFRSLAHPTSGRASLVRVGDRTFLRFEGLRTDNGPDLRVYLSAAPASSGDGDAFGEDFVELARLKGNEGNQEYEVPPGTDVERLRSAVIWCKRFGVAFGAAPVA